MTLSTFSEKDIERLIESFGLELNENFPMSFTECFNAKTDYEKKTLSGASSGFSRMLNGAIPVNITGFNADEIVEKVLRNKKPNIYRSAMVKKIPDIVNDGLRKAIGFKILRDPMRSGNTPKVTLIRERIEAAATLTKASAKGAHKGEATEEVMDAVEKGFKIFSILNQLALGQAITYISERAIVHNDEKARVLLSDIFRRTSEYEQLQIPSSFVD